MSTFPFKTPPFGYFPRPVFTNIVKQWMVDLSTNVALFAPRRRGKTTWTLLELQPAAAAWGLEFAYINLWDDRSDPVGVLAKGLEVAAGLRPPDTRMREISAEISAAVFKVKARKEYPPVTQSTAERVGRAMSVLAAKPKKTLLVIDEFQAIAAADKDSVAIAALRTALETHGDHVVALFTGSERTTLSRMFRDQAAPLLEQARLMDLPELGRDFVEDRATAFQSVTGRKLAVDELAAGFMALGRSPLLLNDVLKEMMTQPGLAIDAAVIEVIEKRGTEDYGVQIDRLSPLDRAVLTRIAKGEKPYAELDKLPRSPADGAAVTKPEVQVVLKRLERARLIEARTGEEKRVGWVIPDPLLERWISRIERIAAGE